MIGGMVEILKWVIIIGFLSYIWFVAAMWHLVAWSKGGGSQYSAVALGWTALAVFLTILAVEV